MDTLIQHGTWPLAIVIIAIVALVMFRSPISGLLNRTRKIGAGNNAIDFSEPKTTELQQMQAPPTGGQIANYSSLGPPSPAVAEIEQQVIQTLNSSNESEEVKKQRLIRGIAVMALQREYEAVYRLIFGSQLELLLQANVAGGIDDAGANAIHQNAASFFPAVHQSGSLDLWLAFLLNHNLIERKDGRIVATPKAKDFMH